ncbi:FAD-dependent oxidoreductase [Tessaracoccus coleopterorum]
MAGLAAATGLAERGVAVTVVEAQPSSVVGSAHGRSAPAGR